VTEAPAIDAPEASETVPEMEPKVDCAATGMLNVARQAKKINRGIASERTRELLIFQNPPTPEGIKGRSRPFAHKFNQRDEAKKLDATHRVVEYVVWGNLALDGHILSRK
jgi:hypothetical protein